MARLAFRFWILGGGIGLCALLNVLFYLKQLSTTTFLVINGVFFLFFLILVFLIYQSISKPIAALLEAVKQGEKGDFSFRVEQQINNEIGLLVESFNRLMEKIQKEVLDVHRTEMLKSDFISNVSHELRTPLTSISGYTKLLAAGDAGPVAPTQKEFLDIIDSNVERLIGLINDFLDFQQMESGKIHLELKSHNLNSLLEECIATFQVLAQKKNLKIEIKKSESEALVSGDRHRLTQIFMNLLSNAVKYTQTGGIFVEVEKSDYSVAVKVRDTGLGISEREREHLFQKFYRTRSGFVSGEIGTGLGLMIVKKLIDVHGGSIRVDSTPGQGTLFSVLFPLSTPEVIPISKMQDSKALISKFKRIWIIDADKKNAEKLQELILQNQEPEVSNELEVHIFSNVMTVLEEFQNQHSPDLVILDPVGYTDIRDIQKKLQFKTPVLIISSSTDATVALSEGAMAWLEKPVNHKRFVLAVRKLMQGFGWKILLADSNTDLRILLKRALEKRGLHVEDLDQGRAVLKRIELEQYDLVLLDMHLHDVPGVEVLKIIHRSPQYHQLPVLMMSSEEKDIPSVDELSNWGISQFLPKYRGLTYIADHISQYLEDRKFLEQHN